MIYTNENFHNELIDIIYDNLVYGLLLSSAWKNEKKFVQKISKDGHLKQSGFKYMAVNLF